MGTVYDKWDVTQKLWDATEKLYDLLRESLTADLKCDWNISIERALGRLDDIENILECRGAVARDPDDDSWKGE